MPRYTCRESATRISTGNRRATARASSLFPDPVDPTRTPIGGGSGARRAGGAIGLVDLDQALDLRDAHRPPALAVGLDEHSVKRYRPLADLEAGRQVPHEARQDGLDPEADDRVSRSGHPHVA